jgi:hypothetical protein
MPVYFLQPVTGGPVKIGHAVDIERRRAQLECHYGQPLALLATLPGGRDEEQAIHHRFASLRFGRSEQFRPGPELMAFINRPLLVDPNPDAVESMEPVRPEIATTVKMTPEFKEWLNGLADHCQLTMTDVVIQSLIRFGKDQDYGPAPKR